MDVSCENCGAHYELDTSRFKGSSLRVQCSSCGHVFRVQKTQAEPLHAPPPSTPEAPKKWVIRYKDGALSIVPDKATLQRWIVERRVSPEDEVSQDEIHWRFLGEVEEFQPFFVVVAQSTATHLGVSQTGVFAAPILTPGQLSVTPSGNIQNFGTLGLTPAAAPIPQKLQQAAMSPAPQIQLQTPRSNGPSLGPSAFSLDSSPKATLEFGLAQALEGLKTSNPALVAAAEAALAQPDQTIASTEAISEADAALAQAPESQERTEISLEGAPSDLEDAVDVNSTSLDHEDDFIATPSTPPQTPPPAVNKPATGEWFLGTSEALEHTHEPSLQSQEPSYEHLPSQSELDDDLRDFSAYEEDAGLGAEDLAFRPKRMGWFGRTLVFLLLVGIVGGGLYTLQPPWSEPLWIRLGLLEASSSSQSLLQQTRVHQLALHEDSWKRASDLMKQAEKAEGRNFLGLVLARTQQQLTRMEALHLSLSFHQQQQERARNRIKQVRRTLATLSPQTPQRAEIEKSLQNQQQSAAQSLEKLQQEEKALNRQMEPLARVAQQQLKMAEELDRHDIRTRLLKAHFNALSPGAATIALRFLQGIEKQPLSPEQRSMLQLLRSALYLRENKTEKASSTLDQVCRERPNWVWPILLRAALWSQQQKTAQAADEFNRAIAIVKDHALATQWRDWLLKPSPPLISIPTQTRTNIKKSGPTAPQPNNTANGNLDKMTFASLLRAAEKLRGRERFRAASRYYFAALKKKRSSRVYAGLGWCMLDANRLGKAQSYFKKALKMGPNNALALFGLGLTFRRRGKKKLAKQTLEAYIQRFPNSSDAREVTLILKSL